MSEAIRHLKLVVVGDGYVGKTTLLVTFTKDFFAPCLPLVFSRFDNFEADMEVDGQRVSMTIWDTVGQDDFERLRTRSYGETDGFLLCFSVDKKRSYESIDTYWIREVRHFCPKTPLILVGTKTDLRDNAAEDDSNKDNFVTSTQGTKTDLKDNAAEDDSNKDKFVTHIQGKMMAAKIKARNYVECSAKEFSGLKEVFEEAVRAILSPKKSHSFSRCTLL